MPAEFNPHRSLELADLIEISPNSLDRQDAIFKLSDDAAQNFPEACRRLIRLRELLVDDKGELLFPSPEGFRELVELLTWEAPDAR